VRTLDLPIESNIKSELTAENYEIEWIDPVDLISVDRYDLCSKIPLARSIIMKDLHSADFNQALDLYLSVQTCINNLYESLPHRRGANDFLHNYQLLIEGMIQNSFDSNQSVLVLNKQGYLLNGAHRLAIAVALNYKVPIIRTEITREMNFSWIPVGNSQISLDNLYLMNLEILKYNKNCRVFVSFEIQKNMNDVIYKYLEKGVRIVYSNQIMVSFNQLVNLNMEMYQHEKWFRSLENPTEITLSRASKISHNSCLVTVGILDISNHVELDLLKKNIRDIFGVGNYPIHITSNWQESLYLGHVLFHKVSRSFLMYNNKVLSNRVWQKLLHLESMRIDWRTSILRLGVAISGSTLLDIMGLRKSEDLDVVVLDKNILLPRTIDDHSLSYDNFKSKDGVLHEYISSDYFLCLGWLWVSQEMQMNKLSKLKDLKSKSDLQLHRRNLIQDNNRLKYRLNQKRFLYSARSFLVYIWMRVKPKLPIWAQKVFLRIIRLFKM
jgi:hypothetical protein